MELACLDELGVGEFVASLAGAINGAARRMLALCCTRAEASNARCSSGGTDYLAATVSASATALCTMR